MPPEPNGAQEMQAKPQSATLVVVPVRPELPPRLDSGQLLRGRTTMQIDHGGQHYTLRVTRDNKLILTK